MYLTIAAIVSIPAFAKHTSDPAAFTFGYALTLLLGGLCLAKLSRVIDGASAYVRWFWVVPCTALAVLNALVYPSTRIPAARSSAPDAMIDPAVRFLSGVHPYSSFLFDGAPISPGPAWIFAHAPLTTLGLIWLVVPLHLGVSAYMLSKYWPPVTGAYAVLLLALPAFLQMSFVGHDLFAVGAALVAITLGVYQETLRPSRAWLLWAIAAGVVATARMPLVVFVVSLAILVARENMRLAVRFAAVAGLVALGTHGLVWQWGDALGFAFQPLHVFGRARGSGTLVFPIGVALSSTAAACIWWLGTTGVVQWLLFVWATIGVPFVAVGIGELITIQHMDWANWEGKVYAGFGLPLLIAAMLLSLLEATERKKSSSLDSAQRRGEF